MSAIIIVYSYIDELLGHVKLIFCSANKAKMTVYDVSYLQEKILIVSYSNLLRHHRIMQKNVNKQRKFDKERINQENVKTSVERRTFKENKKG